MTITAFNFEVLMKREIPYVSIGAILFCISDIILAYNKFYATIPMASLFVLSTYYSAQVILLLEYYICNKIY